MRAKAKGIIVVYETDDLLFEGKVEGYLRKIDRSQHADSIQLRLNALLLCDCVIVSTDYIAEKVGQLGKQVYILRNGLSHGFLGSAEKIKKEVNRNKKEIKLGYFSGSSSHDYDFAILVEPLAFILEKYPYVSLHIVGELQLQGKMKLFNERITRSSFVPYSDLPEEISKVDINLIPLEIEEVFCQAKSELKYIEAGACGVPSIASASDPYQKAIKHKVNGLLAKSESEWIDSLSYLIESTHDRLRIGKIAIKDSFENYSPAVREKEWAKVIEELTQKYKDVSMQRKSLVLSFVYEKTAMIAHIIKSILAYLNK